MSRLIWGAVGERTYELGVDRGVLYIGSAVAVPWNGLISVSEAPVGGETKSYYIDGVKYLERQTSEEFEADIEAYTYPDEFGQCDGTAALGNGLFATQRRRKPFNMSYRSRIGNDVDGPDHGYKIHLVYNALAGPSPRKHNTMSDNLEPFNFTWHISTKPPLLDGHKPTAHFVIDSRYTPRELLSKVEDILYGSEEAEPRLPSVHELLFLFESYSTSTFDAGDILEPYYNTFDGGIIPEPQTSTIDGGVP